VLPSPGCSWLAAALVAGGALLRWWAILTLGRLFTVDVAVQQEHRVVRKGPYRLVRHPAYAGLLCSLLGLGVALGSWLTPLLLLLPSLGGLLYRIVVEERALLLSLGDDYADYRRTVRFRLVPFVL
jgi:protein-S-isoprenylcysteine O-methyltransferase